MPFESRFEIKNKSNIRHSVNIEPMTRADAKKN